LGQPDDLASSRRREEDFGPAGPTSRRHTLPGLEEERRRAGSEAAAENPRRQETKEVRRSRMRRAKGAREVIRYDENRTF